MHKNTSVPGGMHAKFEAYSFRRSRDPQRSRMRSYNLSHCYCICGFQKWTWLYAKKTERTLDMICC